MNTTSGTNPVHPSRVRIVRNGEGARSGPRGPVVYWMRRDQRIRDNWALLHAAQRARKLETGLYVVFCLAPTYLDATLRHYDFMLHGLAETEADARGIGLPFHLLLGDAAQKIPAFLEQISASLLVTDFEPLRIKRAWDAAVLDATSLPVHEVDAHNVVPCRAVSNKREYAARTIRPKIQRMLDEFLEPFPDLALPPDMPDLPAPVDWDRVRGALQVHTGIGPVDTAEPGARAGLTQLADFVRHGLGRYADKRNDPNADALSGLSPWFHFGQIAPQRAALDVVESHLRGGTRQNPADVEGRDTFLEEAIVRRELSDNFCLHTEAYDRLEGLPDWGRATLDKHRADPRDFLYDLAAFEAATTHDPLWNAAQRELVDSGKMHGYMRMYWAKKILEWSPTPEDAVRAAVTLNDRYSLDGRDPNGYVGVLWSVGGLHDRPWKERPVFGTVRYMSAAGCKRKFDTARYIERWTGMPPGGQGRLPI